LTAVDCQLFECRDVQSRTRDKFLTIFLQNIDELITFDFGSNGTVAGNALV